MSKKIKIHPQLHDVFGQEQSLIELIAIITFGTLIPVALYQAFTDAFTQPALWKSILATVFILDIAAGCVANFTKSTNNFYAQRAKHRWIFIAIHFHIIIVAYGLEADIYNAVYIWAYTILAAIMVNLLKNTSFQIFFGGLLLACGLTINLLLPTSQPIMAIIQSLFMLKVIFSFSVDHYPTEEMH
ncbi:MAG: hypothetical protein COB13_006055 [OCS116 cluster bacterium]|uniref:Uncharacterized protein n=1 Tax=OCS116 cluster bacterium TaxID=2030921 RepID=A0A2A4Z418_9PROT|nr:hypothetical protein [OCS116 cluster bacterium]